MLENCIAVIRKEGAPSLAEALRSDPSNTVGHSALELIMRAEQNPGNFDLFRHLILEAPRRSDLPWDELAIIRAMLEANDRLKTTIFIGPKAHSWSQDSRIEPEGATQLTERLSRHGLAPRLFTGELDTLSSNELQTGWHFLQTGNQIYRMAPQAPQPDTSRRSTWGYLKELARMDSIFARTRL